MSAPKFAPKLARWFANDLVITAAVRAASGESSGKLPSSVREVGGKCLTQRRWMSAPWLAQRFTGDLAISAEVHAADHEADRLASTKQSAWCPAWRPGNIR